eukprot:6345337-Prymnesium_polylepis.1
MGSHLRRGHRARNILDRLVQEDSDGIAHEGELEELNHGALDGVEVGSGGHRTATRARIADVHGDAIVRKEHGEQRHERDNVVLDHRSEDRKQRKGVVLLAADNVHVVNGRGGDIRRGRRANRWRRRPDERAVHVGCPTQPLPFLGVVPTQDGDHYHECEGAREYFGDEQVRTSPAPTQHRASESLASLCPATTALDHVQHVEHVTGCRIGGVVEKGRSPSLVHRTLIHRFETPARLLFHAIGSIGSPFLARGLRSLVGDQVAPVYGLGRSFGVLLEPQRERQERNQENRLEREQAVVNEPAEALPLLHKQCVDESLLERIEQKFLRRLARVQLADELHGIVPARTCRIDPRNIDLVLRGGPPLPHDRRSPTHDVLEHLVVTQFARQLQ